MVIHCGLALTLENMYWTSSWEKNALMYIGRNDDSSNVHYIFIAALFYLIFFKVFKFDIKNLHQNIIIWNANYRSKFFP